MFRDMEQWNRMRHRVLRDGVSIHQVQREKAIFRTTNPAPPSSDHLPYSGPPFERISLFVRRPLRGWVNPLCETSRPTIHPDVVKRKNCNAHEP